MTTREIINAIRLRVRRTNTAANSDAVLRDLVQEAYRILVQEFCVRNPMALVEAQDVTLTGLYTALPSSVGVVVRVEDATGLGATTEGRELPEIPPHQLSRTETLGYCLQGRRIALNGMQWENKDLRIFYRPDVEDIRDNTAVPTFIPPLYHNAIVWKTAELVEGRDGEPTPYVMQQAQRTFAMWLLSTTRINRIAN